MWRNGLRLGVTGDLKQWLPFILQVMCALVVFSVVKKCDESLK